MQFHCNSVRECFFGLFVFFGKISDRQKIEKYIETSSEQWIEHRFTEETGSSPMLVTDNNGLSCNKDKLLNGTWKLKKKYQLVSDRAKSLFTIQMCIVFRLGLSNVYLKYGTFVVVYSFLWGPKVVMLILLQNEQAAT